LLIDGTWETPDAALDVTDPADGTLVGSIGWGTGADARRAADAAARALPGWAGSPARRRADIRLDAARLITERTAGIGALLAREAGKRLPEAVAEVGFSAEYFRWFAEQVRRLTDAGATEMGLAGYVWSRDAGRCWRLTERLDAGILGVNDALPSVAFAPMGGTTQSGLGREGAALGLEEFQDVRYVAWRA
jgi:acyl-CoA reductase-like NAD-dependent aldehyde dehydrogenase